MTRTVKYESGTVLPEAITYLFEKYEGIISDICMEPDKLDCFFTAMRSEMVVWFSDHQKGES